MQSINEHCPFCGSLKVEQEVCAESKGLVLVKTCLDCKACSVVDLEKDASEHEFFSSEFSQDL